VVGCFDNDDLTWR